MIGGWIRLRLWNSGSWTALVRGSFEDRSGPPPDRVTCTVEGCDKPHNSNGLCNGHWQRVREGRDVNTPLRVMRRNVPDCSIDWCDRKMKSMGYCDPHYKRSLRGADMDKPISAKKWKVRPEGYPNCPKCVEVGELCDPHNKILLRYKLTRDQFAAMLAGGCGACGVLADTNGMQLVVDHDHSCCPGRNTCGECVRGVLCTRHNILAGFLESPDRDAVDAYLDSWRATA